MGRAPRVSSPTTKAFADRLDELVHQKKAQRLSHDEICRQIGVSSGVMSEWMSDCKTASIENLAKLAKYFEVSADYLLGLTNIMSPDIDTRKICEITGLSDEAIISLKSSKYTVDALNFLLVEEAFRTMLMNTCFFKSATIASGLHYHVSDLEMCEEDIDNSLRSISDSNYVSKEVQEALNTYLEMENKKIGKHKEYERFHPEDFYELRITKNLQALLLNIANNSWLIAEEIVSKNNGIDV